jgi:hypothetical protein
MLMLMAKGGKQIKGRQQRNAMLMEKEPFGGRRNGEKWSGLFPVWLSQGTMQHEQTQAFSPRN